MVEESIHVNFYDKGPDHDTSKYVESIADLQVYEEHSDVGSSDVSIIEVRDS